MWVVPDDPETDTKAVLCDCQVSEPVGQKLPRWVHGPPREESTGPVRPSGLSDA